MGEINHLRDPSVSLACVTSSISEPNLYQGGWDYGLYGDLNDLTISQDGQTLFVANQKGVLVIPVNAFTAAN